MRSSLALGLTLAVGSACAKHEEAHKATAETAMSSAQGSAQPTSPPPPDPKEAARTSGLLGPADQGAFDDQGFDSGSGSSGGSGSAVAKAKPKPGTSDKHTGPKTVKPEGPIQPGVDDLNGDDHHTRSPQRISGSVRIGEITASDDNAKERVRAAVARGLNAIEACYRETLSRAPAVEGTFDVVFFVDPGGTFERAAQLSSDLGDGVLGDCIVRTVNKMKLDHELGGKTPIKVGVVLSFKHT